MKAHRPSRHSLGGGQWVAEGMSALNDTIISPEGSEEDTELEQSAVRPTDLMYALDETWPPMDEPELGTIVGRYELLDILGEGGMGTVYLAEHTALKRKVALKMLHPGCAENPTNVQRFFSEAKAVNQIQHDHIIEITDFVDGLDKYYIMELLEGENLAQVISDVGPLPLTRAVDIAIQVCDALQAVHGADIVHRDLKPANVFLTERLGKTDFVKLLDFGVAKLVAGPRGESVHQTAVGTLLGTPDYMAPEQAAGAHVDERTDVYALGIILYEMTTGRRPFEAATCGEMLVKHISAEVPPPNTCPTLPQVIPAPLEQLILQCLEKLPDDRPATMTEVAERLKALRAGLPVVDGEVRLGPPSLCAPLHTPSTTLSQDGLRNLHSFVPSRRRRSRALLTSALVLVALAFGGAALGTVFKRMHVVSQSDAAPAVPTPSPVVEPVERVEKAVAPAKKDPPTAATRKRNVRRRAVRKKAKLSRATVRPKSKSEPRRKVAKLQPKLRKPELPSEGLTTVEVIPPSVPDPASANAPKAGDSTPPIPR